MKNTVSTDAQAAHTQGIAIRNADDSSRRPYQIPKNEQSSIDVQAIMHQYV
jgi:hypothetical protein